MHNTSAQPVWLTRGYIQPRQEAAHGRLAWLVQGSLWACFHLFKPWAVPAMLFNCQAIPFVAQKTKSTWPGVVIHFVGNGIGSLPFVIALFSK